MAMRLAVLLLVLVGLTSCAELPEQVPPPPAAPVAVETPPAVPQSQPLKYLVGRKLTPQPTRPLTVTSRCSTRDAVGTATRLNVQVKNAEVKTFAAEVAIPKRGVCRFDLKNFEQKERLPQVLLTARDGSPCSVRMWEQGSRVTIAFNQCPAACPGDTFDYLWPIMVDAKSGRCF